MQRIISFFQHLTITDLWNYWTNLVALSSLTLFGLQWLDGFIQTFHPRRVLNERFWVVFDRIEAAIQYISLSQTKIAPKLPWSKK
jgi:hypothetical protein